MMSKPLFLHVLVLGTTAAVAAGFSDFFPAAATEGCALSFFLIVRPIDADRLNMFNLVPLLTPSLFASFHEKGTVIYTERL